MTTLIDGTKLDDIDVRELLAEFDADAKTYSRRGYCGTRDPRYDDAHAAINDALCALGY